MKKLRGLGIISVLLAVTLFSGCYRSSYDWFIQTVNDNYYYGELGDIPETNLAEIAEKYLDRYSGYYTKEEYDRILLNNSGNKSGLGFSYAYVDGKGVFINLVLGNSPAYMSGLRDGEIVIGGSKAGGDEVAFTSKAGFDNFILSAGEGERITLTSADGDKFELAKAEYNASYTYMSTNSSTWVFKSSADGGLALYENSEKISYLPDGAAYIRLTQFYGKAASEFYSLVEKFNALNCTAMILDLRSNGGGYLTVMNSIAGSFSDGEVKPSLIARDKHGNETIYYCDALADGNALVSKNTEVYVLANSSTASASEALIGAMVCYGALDYKNIFLSDYSQEYLDWLGTGGQEIKTARTFGKGIMQATFRNERTGEALKLTTSQIFWPDGKTCIHDKGLTVKDGCTPVSAQWVRTKADDELKAAVEIINSEK